MQNTSSMGTKTTARETWRARCEDDCFVQTLTLTADLMTQVLSHTTKKSRVRKCGMCASMVWCFLQHLQLCFANSVQRTVKMLKAKLLSLSESAVGPRETDQTGQFFLQDCTVEPPFIACNCIFANSGQGTAEQLNACTKSRSIKDSKTQSCTNHGAVPPAPRPSTTLLDMRSHGRRRKSPMQPPGSAVAPVRLGLHELKPEKHLSTHGHD